MEAALSFETPVNYYRTTGSCFLEDSTRFVNTINQSIHSMEQCSSWEANGRSTCEEIHYFQFNSEAYRVTHNSPSLVPILSQINPTLFI
jgi:hypothetical protein